MDIYEKHTRRLFLHLFQLSSTSAELRLEPLDIDMRLRTRSRLRFVFWDARSIISRSAQGITKSRCIHTKQSRSHTMVELHSNFTFQGSNH